ncbi:hypothetical protein O0Z71_04550 [Ligilactobacillus saerimneri]|uniref:hypothetical protein n=1 Tax=Ligilactobacillus saerimneri TaxID=228229 RepID=UPI0022A76895|nr:hypothetical protein [Ligilactobacillus saerimneri]MCZ0891712.1 hypothetical protein [Ligilactobacillus saerimneri]
MYKQENKQLTGIQRYYHRLRQSESGSDYYIEPRESCPINILNCDNKFAVITFDRDDDYIVVGNKRYYLTKQVAIKGTNKLQRRIAVIDIDEMEQSKSYKFDKKFTRQYTLKVDSFNQLRQLAMDQFEHNGAPFIKQLLRDGQYIYEPSFSQQVMSA